MWGKPKPEFPIVVATIPVVKGSGGHGEAKLEARAAFTLLADAFNFAAAGSDQYRDRQWFVFENGLPVARYIDGRNGA